MEVRGRGAKGSVKNRIYQFWLIQMFLKRKEKKKQQKLVKERKKQDAIRKRKQEIVEMIYAEETKVKGWKLLPNPEFLNKKEGVIVTLYPIGKKPDRVVEIYEEKKKVGIGDSSSKKTEDMYQEELTVLAKKAKIVVGETKEATQVNPQASKDLETKQKLLKQNLTKIEGLQNEYQKIVIAHPEIKKTNSNITKTKTSFSTISELEAAEVLCRQELNRVNNALQEVSRKAIPVHSQPRKERNKLKTGAAMMAVTGGTLVAFPAILQSALKPKTSEKQQKSKEGDRFNAPSSKKTASKQGENKKISTQDEKKKLKKEEEIGPKFKLYRNKLEASKEAEILIQSEIKRQKDYLKMLNAKVEKLDISKKTTYHFNGIHKLIGNVLKFTLGVLTIPFSRNRIFGTMVGVTLINNSVRGMRNSFVKKENQISFVEFHKFARAIDNEKLALAKTKSLIVDSLDQLRNLKSELEYQFYSKISYEEYAEMKIKLDVIEEKLLEKQREIEAVQNNLEKAEEKNKVKMKKMKEVYDKQ